MTNHKTYLQILLFILLALFTIPCFSQQPKYNFSFSSAPLTDVISEISRQSKVNILYNPNILPGNILISGSFKNVTLTETLDTVFRRTSIAYKFYKKDIVLYKKNEKINVAHNQSKEKIEMANTKKVLIIDTITYSLTTYDTVVSYETNYINVSITDTTTVFDTVKVIRRVSPQKLVYKPKKSGFIAGLSLTQGLLYSTILSDTLNDVSENNVKSSLVERSANGAAFSVLYKRKSWLFETGIHYTKHTYSFAYKFQTQGIVIRIDTIDIYYSLMQGLDTNWIYVTEEIPVESSTNIQYKSESVLTYISLPILVGYSKTFRNITLEPKVGALLTFYSGSKGYYLNSLGAIEEKKVPNSSLFMDVYAAVGLDYFLDNKLHLLLQPYLIYSIYSNKIKATGYYFRNLQIGSQVGLRYYF